MTDIRHTTDQRLEGAPAARPDPATASDAAAAQHELSDAAAAQRELSDAAAALSDAELEVNIVEMIKTVYDPEIPVNVYDLGLIYGVHINPDRTVQVRMTLTAPNCPAAGFLPGQVEQRVRMVEGVAEAEVDLTFDPPYHPDMMSEEAKLELGFL
jgi:FeS assembly SUF system protein